MNIITLLIANAKPAVLTQPGQRPLDYPAKAAQSLAGVDTSARDSRHNIPLQQGVSTTIEVIALVGMQLHGPRAWSAAPAVSYRRNGVDDLFEHLAIVNIGSRQQTGKWRASCIYHKMALRALFAPIRWIRPNCLCRSVFCPPLGARGAGTLAESTLARNQSSWSASAILSRRTACNSAQTPASCQSRSLRQQVIPDPQPISCGSISQGMPVFRTNKMPESTALSLIRGLPPRGFAGASGRSGSTIDHNSSETRGFAIHKAYHNFNKALRFC